MPGCLVDSPSHTLAIDGGGNLKADLRLSGATLQILSNGLAAHISADGGNNLHVGADGGLFVGQTTIGTGPLDGGNSGQANQVTLGGTNSLVTATTFPTGRAYLLGTRYAADLTAGPQANSLAAAGNPLAALWDPVTVFTYTNTSPETITALLTLAKQGTEDCHIQAAQECYLSYEVNYGGDNMTSGTTGWLGYGLLGLEGAGTHMRFPSPNFAKIISMPAGYTMTVQVRTCLVWFTPILSAATLGATQYIYNAGVLQVDTIAA